MDKDKNVFLNSDPIETENLAVSVKNLIAAQTDKSVVLRADTEVAHGLIIKIMDLLRKEGIYKIVISTEKPFTPGA